MLRIHAKLKKWQSHSCVKNKFGYSPGHLVHSNHVSENRMSTYQIHNANLTNSVESIRFPCTSFHLVKKWDYDSKYDPSHSLFGEKVEIIVLSAIDRAKGSPVAGANATHFDFFQIVSTTSSSYLWTMLPLESQQAGAYRQQGLPILIDRSKSSPVVWTNATHFVLFFCNFIASILTLQWCCHLLGS